jgi:hypothetical protein
MPTNEEYTFDPGTSLSPLFGAYAASIEQAITLATPNTYRGMVIVSSTTPATSGQPSGYPTGWYEWHKRCVWVDPTDLTAYGWDGTTYALLKASVADNTITNDMIQNDTIRVEKLNGTGGAVGNILQIDINGDPAWTAATGLIGANSLNINTILSPGTSNYMLTSLAGVKTWTLFDSATIVGLFNTNEFPVDYLARGTALQVLGTNAGATAVTWGAALDFISNGTISHSKLTVVPANAGLYLKRDGSGNVVDAALPAIPAITHAVLTIGTLPAAGTPTSTAHTLAGAPTQLSLMLVCGTTDQGYAVGDRVSATAVKCDSGVGSADFSEAYYVYADATNAVIARTDSASALLIPHKTTGVVATFTPASWSAILTAVLHA